MMMTKLAFVAESQREKKERVMGQLRALFTLVMIVLATSAKADLALPDGRVLLTVSGKIEITNASSRAEFDRNMLEQLGLVELKTSTPWTEGEVLFTGVSLARLLDAVAARGSMVKATAANDYVAEIPISTLREGQALLAMSMAGKPLSLRNKGPLWIVYPWSDRPDLDRTEIHNYAVWQLISLHVR